MTSVVLRFGIGFFTLTILAMAMDHVAWRQQMLLIGKRDILIKPESKEYKVLDKWHRVGWLSKAVAGGTGIMAIGCLAFLLFASLL